MTCHCGAAFCYSAAIVLGLFRIPRGESEKYDAMAYQSRQLRLEGEFKMQRVSMVRVVLLVVALVGVALLGAVLPVAANHSITISGCATTASVAENTATTETVADCEASDAEGTVVFTLSGADGSRFNIDNLGVITFKQAPDYENPRDANRDNIYNVTVRATDTRLC